MSFAHAYHPPTSYASSEVPDGLQTSYAEAEPGAFGGGERPRMNASFHYLLPQFSEGQSSSFPPFRSPADTFRNIDGEDTEFEDTHRYNHVATDFGDTGQHRRYNNNLNHEWANPMVNGIDGWENGQ